LNHSGQTPLDFYGLYGIFPASLPFIILEEEPNGCTFLILSKRKNSAKTTMSGPKSLQRALFMLGRVSFFAPVSLTGFF
jgi:hypothetical protein